MVILINYLMQILIGQTIAEAPAPSTDKSGNYFNYFFLSICEIEPSMQT